MQRRLRRSRDESKIWIVTLPDEAESENRWLIAACVEGPIAEGVSYSPRSTTASFEVALNDQVSVYDDFNS